MRKHGFVSVAMIGACLFGLAGIAGAEAGIEEKRSVNARNFTVISVGWGINLEVIQDEAYEVTVQADGTMLDRIAVDKMGEQLHIYLLPGLPVGLGRKMLVRVRTPRLEKISASGGSPVLLEFDLGEREFEAELSGGSGLEGTLRAGEVRLEASGGSKIGLEGGAQELELGGSGGSRFLLEEFAVEEAQIHLSGGSQARVHVSRRLEVSMSGGSRTYYRGNPRIDGLEFSGGSSLEKIP